MARCAKARARLNARRLDPEVALKMLTAASAPKGELRVTVASWDALTRENERLRAEVKHKTLLTDRVEHSKGLVTQEKNAHAARAAEAERRAAQLENALAYERALAAGMFRENQDLRTQASDLRAQAHTAHRLMEECTRMVERISRFPMPATASE